MMNTTRNKPLKTAVLLTMVCLAFVGSPSASAESLFRAGISYQTSQPYTPRSLFSLPRPATVGDMVTINILQQTQITIQNNSTISRQQNLNENNTLFVNRFLRRWLSVDKELFPSVDGVNNLHEIDVRGQTQKNYQYRDNITCQVVQVLPNGHLVVQGKKTIFANQEEQNLYVTGIVNPYFLDAKNAVTSAQVGNLQMHVAGKGQFSRQQGDGVLGKYFQLFN